MPVISLILAALLATIPPLTGEQETALATAYDGGDHREAAFDALLANTARWREGIGDTPIRIDPDLARLRGNPQPHRGDLYLLAGQILHVEPLRPPFRGVTAWVLEIDGDLAVVYVDFRNTPDDIQVRFAPETTVQIPARFYKTVEAEAQDDRTHTYPAFVGAHPEKVPTSATGNDTGDQLLAVMVTLIAVLGGIFLILFLIVRRRADRSPAPRAHRSMLAAYRSDEEGDTSLDETELPDDPADALDVLKRRSEQI